MNATRTPIEFDGRYLENCTTPVGRLLSAGMARHAGIPADAMRVLNAYAVIILTEGGGVYKDANRLSGVVEPGDCLLLFPDIAHSYAPPFGGLWREWFFHFEGAAFDLWRHNGLLNSHSPVVKGAGDALLPRLQEIAARPSSTAPAHLERVCDLLGALGTLRGPTSEQMPRSWLEHAQHLLSMELNEELPLENVAREVGMSYSTFRARFALESGQTPARFRALCRVRAAQSLLERPELSVRAIARALGWADEFTFAKNFKALTGQTPRTFRVQKLSTKNSLNLGNKGN